MASSPRCLTILFDDDSSDPADSASLVKTGGLSKAAGSKDWFYPNRLSSNRDETVGVIFGMHSLEPTTINFLGIYLNSRLTLSAHATHRSNLEAISHKVSEYPAIKLFSKLPERKHRVRGSSKAPTPNKRRDRLVCSGRVWRDAQFRGVGGGAILERPRGDGNLNRELVYGFKNTNNINIARFFKFCATYKADRRTIQRLLRTCYIKSIRLIAFKRFPTSLSTERNGWEQKSNLLKVCSFWGDCLSQSVADAINKYPVTVNDNSTDIAKTAGGDEEENYPSSDDEYEERKDDTAVIQKMNEGITNSYTLIRM
ncbi:hypothetical protein HHI36_018324 [Cryptolaemus montrouzieri]|uniref:Uncharacterized protein n=1 Tax=Cryptolaemus montrouzieri TaxID=559131 RepID=A0ABD2P0L0_9CUCU